MSTALDSRPVPPIAIDPENSTTAAAWALLTRDPVVVTRDLPEEAAVLDLQLMRRARAEGLVALPLGQDPATGVLIVHGPRQALARVASQARFYRRLGQLAGRRPARPDGARAEGVRQAARALSNPLGIIKNYLALVRTRLGETPPVVAELNIVDEELDRVVRILRDLGGETAPEPGTEAPAPSNPEPGPGFPCRDFRI